MKPLDVETQALAVLTIAETYIDLTVGDLEKLLEQEVERSDAGQLPHRGFNPRFWSEARRRLAREVAKQQVAGSATAGLAASQVVTWAINLGLDLTEYRLPISILVALVVKSIWEGIDDNRVDQDDDETD